MRAFPPLCTEREQSVARFAHWMRLQRAVSAVLEAVRVPSLPLDEPSKPQRPARARRPVAVAPAGAVSDVGAKRVRILLRGKDAPDAKRVKVAREVACLAEFPRPSYAGVFSFPTARRHATVGRPCDGSA